MAELTSKQVDQLDRMIAWEEGTLSNEDTVILFQELIDNGMAWSLQGCYGRQAAALIEAGYCHAAENVLAALARRGYSVPRPSDTSN
jgi:hypothetical protein